MRTRVGVLRYALPTAVYPLDEAARAWKAQASSPGKKIVVIP